MDAEMVRSGLQEAIPFNKYVGLEVLEVGEGRGVVRLPDDQKLHNHVGSQHAAGLFAAGEAASGGAFLGAFFERVAEVTPLAKAADIEYLKLGKGAITATATLEEDKRQLFERLDADGKIEFPVRVEMTDGDGNVVATMTVHWHVRQKN
jgi:acyl-coenzyme A thioesterase PaaI-like protein